MEALSVHAADVSSYACWFGPAWLAREIHRKCGAIAVRASITSCEEAQAAMEGRHC